MRKHLIIAAAILISSATPTWSQPTAAPSAVELDLARRYVEAIDFKKQMDVMMDVLLPQFAAAEGSSRSPEERALIMEIVKESILALTPQMAERMAVATAEVLTEAELRAVVAFYESAEGRSVSAKSAVLAQKGQEVMMGLEPQLQAEMEKRFCAKMGQRADCMAQPRAKS